MAQLVERYVVAKGHEWSPSEPQTQRARDHITPYVGDIPAESLRSIDATQIYTDLRAKGRGGVRAVRPQALRSRATRLQRAGSGPCTSHVDEHCPSPCR